MEVIVDTCIRLDIADGKLSVSEVDSKIKGANIYCSVITLGELEFGISVCDDPQTGAEKQDFFNRISTLPILTLAPTTATIFGSFAVTMKRRQKGNTGANPRKRYHDLWIAAQAVEGGFALLTDNKSDFKNLPELKLLML
ncbi:MAG: PIN domain-containing protein [Planctomycetota bacterium]|jgi:predicted nucleic acid-binding protein|nr:PIN domain-containing protein [Planctomycetota bacterium]